LGLPIIAAIACVGVGALLFGLDIKAEFMRKVKTYDLPAIVRNRIGDSKIRSELNAQKSKINSEISYKIRNDSKFRSVLKDKISSAASGVVQDVAKQITFDLSR